ncbi:MAG: fumarylacetoacetate hydrolase family protein [Anaerolineae bacterium]
MKREQQHFVHVMTDEGPRWGVAVGERLHALRGDPFGTWELAEDLGHLDAAPLLAPVIPSKIICVGLNYLAHAAESNKEIPPEPLLFFKPPSAVIGPEANIVLPAQSQRVDYEAELAVVIGKRCRNVSAEEAWSYVLGVTCGNDVTARDLQRRDNQWTRAKGFDTFCPLGPWVVTGLSEDAASDLEVTCRVNGEVRQAARTSEMIVSASELIAYASSIMTLEPADVIMTGTPDGIGPLAPGDVVEVEMEQIGLLRNYVV